MAVLFRCLFLGKHCFPRHVLFPWKLMVRSSFHYLHEYPIQLMSECTNPDMHTVHITHITVQYAVQASPCFCSLIRLSLYMERLSVRLRGERSLKQRYIPQGYLLARGEMAEVFALIPSTPVWICRHGLDIRLAHQCPSRRDRDARAQSARISLRWEIPQGALDVQEKSKWG